MEPIDPDEEGIAADNLFEVALAATMLQVFQWDPKTRRYLDRRGRPVAWDRVERASSSLSRKFVDRAAVDLRALAVGRINLREWQNRMVRHVKRLHTAQLALAHGGWQQLKEEHYRELEQVLRFQLHRLNAFGQDLSIGRLAPGGLNAVARMTLYGKAGWATFQEGVLTEAIAMGMMEEENVINPMAEHCYECEDESSRGWVPIGTLIRVGARKCRVNCRCRLRYRNPLTGQTYY